MSLFILDTDHASLFLAGNKIVVEQVRQQISDVVTTIITVQELYNGWAGRINDPRESKNLVRIYGKLLQTTEFLKAIEILPFDESANICYERLLLRHKSLAKKRLEKDVRIAAIALSIGSTIVTRNYKDFSQIPDLKIVNWADIIAS